MNLRSYNILNMIPNLKGKTFSLCNCGGNLKVRIQEPDLSAMFCGFVGNSRTVCRLH